MRVDGLSGERVRMMLGSTARETLGGWGVVVVVRGKLPLAHLPHPHPTPQPPPPEHDGEGPPNDAPAAVELLQVGKLHQATHAPAPLAPDAGADHLVARLRGWA